MAALPPPTPPPPRQSPTDTFFEGFNEVAGGVWNDFRILIRIFIFILIAAFAWGAVFFMSQGDPAWLVDLPIIWVLWRFQQRFARPRR